MNDRHEPGSPHSIGWALLTFVTLAAALLLTSCDTMKDHTLRMSGGTGVARVRGEVDTINGTSTERSRGNAHGLRIEISKPVRDFDGTTAGLRLQATMRDVSEDGFGQGGTGRLDLETVGGEFHGVLRTYFPISDEVRPYGELFGGLSYNQGDLTASGGGLPNPLKDSGKDWTGVGGLGIGVEFDLSSSSSLFIQGDYSMRFSDVDPFRFRLDDVMLWVGGEIRF